jgi:hypothetical protein
MEIRIITRQEAMRYLERHKHPRGPGPNCDYINYGLINEHGKILAVARIAAAPYGNAPCKALLGPILAKNCVYLARQFAAGLTHQDLVEFVQGYTQRLHQDLLERGHDIRYLLSMDDPQEVLIEHPQISLRRLTRGVTGKTYVEAGALYAGKTRSHKSGRYVDGDGRVRSTYRDGKTITAQVEQMGLPMITENQKQRFLFVLAARDSLQYRAWRNALPPGIREPVWGKETLGWVQPRLLFSPKRLLRKAFA